MLLHRVALEPERYGDENDDMRLAAAHLSEAILKYAQVAEKYGDAVEAVVPTEELWEQFDSILPVGTKIALTGLKDATFNGKGGVVCSRLNAKGRVGVMLDTGKILNARPVNLAFGVDPQLLEELQEMAEAGMHF